MARRSRGKSTTAARAGTPANAVLSRSDRPQSDRVIEGKSGDGDLTGRLRQLYQTHLDEPVPQAILDLLKPRRM